MYKLRGQELDWKQIDDEIVILDGNRSTYLSVDGSGVALWHALMEGATRDELVATLVSRYDVDQARAGVDVDTFLQTLGEKDLLAR
jgi:hypothetical protein